VFLMYCFDFYLYAYIHIFTHIHQTRRHIDTQTHRRSDTQTQRHTDTKTHRHKNTLTRRHAKIQTLRHTDTHTHRHIETRIHTFTLFHQKKEAMAEHIYYTTRLFQPTALECRSISISNLILIGLHSTEPGNSVVYLGLFWVHKSSSECF